MNLTVCLKSLLLFAIVFGKFLKVNASSGCGNLAIRNRYITAGKTVKLQFYPVFNLQHIIEGAYRWLFLNNTKWMVVFNKEASSMFDSRISEENYTLFIEDVKRRDEGEYKVECWYGDPAAPTFMWSSPVDLKLQEPFFTTTKPTNKDTTILKVTSLSKTPSPRSSTTDDVKLDATNENLSTDQSDNSMTTVVGVVSGIAVLIAAATVVVLFVKKKRTLKRANGNNGENAGIMDDDAEYAIVNDDTPRAHILDQNNTLIDTDPYSRIDQPPVQPVMQPYQQNGGIHIVNKTSDEYSKVIPKSKRGGDDNRNACSSKLEDKKTEEYATVIPKSERRNNNNECIQNLKSTSGERETYAEIIPKSERIQNSGESNPNVSEKEAYATVIPKSERQCTQQQSRSNTSINILHGNQYSNIIPRSEIDLTASPNCEYSKVIPKDQRLLDIHGIDPVRNNDASQTNEVKHHEYDTPSPIIRRKTGVKELQYIEIDHSETSSYRSQSTESLASRPIEYVDIDFTKKAFVAPKRYPPPPSPNRKN